MTDPLQCLANAFEQMNFRQCFDRKSFGIDFANLAFEIYLPVNHENRFEFISKRIIVERTEIIKENFRANLPMMIIEKTASHSIILIEQENDLNSLQTANVTITFHHQVRSFLLLLVIHLFLFALVRGHSLSMSSLSFNKFLIKSQVKSKTIAFSNHIVRLI